ncbi:hypothetical protein NEISUBOT_03577 [Neisseria subflava NJ9703]|uniref:Uncharacterized protein n=1 Tax=Neisseria subflava NJ9703 TaxID=546268 RepID=A0A9W5IS57_NEISU|nr:hypothetical protein NEISUBOT_03577 [Neisseria subflava NJ9703]
MFFDFRLRGMPKVCCLSGLRSTKNVSEFLKKFHFYIKIIGSF